MATGFEAGSGMASEVDGEYFADSDSEAEFEGFDIADIRQPEVLQGNRGVFEIPELDDDRDYPSDIQTGWRRQNTDPEAFAFSGSAGLSIDIDIDSLEKPIDYFYLFLNKTDFDMWATETNNYARQVIASRGVLPQHSRLHKWHETTGEEITQWLGLFITTGLVQKPLLEDYWSTDSVIWTPFFSSTMPRDRFLNILSFFHLNNNENYIRRGEPNFDPLFKVRPLYDVANTKFLECFTPNQHIAIDEGMVPWKGRLSFRQYLPNKPDKFGMKLYMLCDSETGYINLFDVYTGKDYDPNPEREETEADEGHTYQVVVGLMKRAQVLNKGYMLFLDNYYSSPKLYDDLYAQQTMTVGTARLNRKNMPVALKNANLKKGEVIYRQKGNLLALKWKDKRDVTMLSTVHKATFTITNRDIHNTGEPVVIPSTVVTYNKYMGGVDHADQLNKYYTMTRKTIKWWKKLALHIINAAITNAYILHKKYHHHPLSHFNFRKELVRDLVAEHQRPSNLKGRRYSGNPQTRLVDRHFPSEIPAQVGAKRKNPCRKCAVCNTSTGKRHQKGEATKVKSTRYWCEDCATPLCVTPCFKRFHTLKHYQLQRGSTADGDSSSSSDEN